MRHLNNYEKRGRFMNCTQRIKHILTYGLILILSTAIQACGGGGGDSASGTSSTLTSPSLLWGQANWDEANWE